MTRDSLRKCRPPHPRPLSGRRASGRRERGGLGPRVGAAAAGLLLVALAAPAEAVVIFLKSGGAPVKAALVREDADKVVVRQTRPDGTAVEREILRADIDDVIVSVSAERLEQLGRANPSAYRDYADELAEKREDPDARETALRLYLIAAWLDPPRLGRGCLLGMAGLARNPSEERAFRAMAFLLDPQHDRRLLAAPEASLRPDVSPRAKTLPPSVLKPLVLLRQGKYREAQLLARRAPYRDQFAEIEQFLPYDEFLGACQDYPRVGLSGDVLRKLIQIELTFGGLGQPSGEAAAGPAAGAESWSDTVRLGRTRAVPSLALETITEFDPRKYLYRGGEWVGPK